MAKKPKNGNITRPADRFYDYLTEHRGEVLRYMTAALVTGILQLILNVFLPSAVALSGITAFFIRFVLLFLALKYWAYGEIGSGPFYTGRQVMLTVMSVTVCAYLFNYISIFLTDLTNRPVLINYIVQACLEIIYFLLFQFFIFKEPKND
jgi:hypothetical protein